MLFESPHGRSGKPFLRGAQNRDELTKVGDAMKASADAPAACKDAILTISIARWAFGTATAFLNAHLKGGGDNAQAYFERARENDLALTHTLINPQANRAVGPSKQRNPFLAARIKESDSGITFVAQGCWRHAHIRRDLVFPCVLRNPSKTPYAFAFGIPVQLLPQVHLPESLDYDRNSFDHPLGSRFEELDAVVILMTSFLRRGVHL